MDLSWLRVRMEKQLADELYSLIDGDIIELLMETAKIGGDKDMVKTLHQGMALPVTSKLMPDFHKLCLDIKSSLKIKESIDFYIVNSPEVNAYAIRSREPERPHTVAINSGLMERFNFQELKFILGHELGHLISGKIKLDDIIRFLLPQDERKDFPLGFIQKNRLWLNLSELTADRYGYIAAGDMGIVANCFFKMTSGLKISDTSFSPEAYLEENEETLLFFKRNGSAILAEHPVNPLRIKAIQIFSESRLYDEFLRNPEVVVDDPKLHERMDNEIIGLMLDLFRDNLDRFFTDFMVSGGIMIANMDGNISEGELDEIIKAVSGYLYFPREYIASMLEEKNLSSILDAAVKGVLSEAPEYSPLLVEYLVNVALADKHCGEKELACVFDIATRNIELSEKEAARLIADAVRRRFIPRMY